MIRQVKTAAMLWVVFAVVVWNVVFDRVLVLEGRRYVYAAATAVASPIALFGLLAVAFAAKRRPHR